MNELKKIIIAIVVTLAIFVASDLIVGAIGDACLRQIHNINCKESQNNYRLNQVETDIVIIGSSRCQCHYDVSLLNDSISHYSKHHYSIFNAGIGGLFVNSTACAVESILNRYTPKLIILEVGEEEFLSTGDILFSALHYNRNSVVRNYINDFDQREQILLKSNLYRYNGRIYDLFSSTFLKSVDTTGYTPLHNVMKPSPDEAGSTASTKKKPAYDPYSLKNFTRVLQICNEQNVHLVVVTSPRYYPCNDNNYLRSLCAQYDIPYIERYNTSEFNTNPHYFQDANHLNDSGAHVYTKLFFQDLKPYLEHLR